MNTVILVFEPHDEFFALMKTISKENPTFNEFIRCNHLLAEDFSFVDTTKQLILSGQEDEILSFLSQLCHNVLYRSIFEAIRTERQRILNTFREIGS